MNNRNEQSLLMMNVAAFVITAIAAVLTTPWLWVLAFDFAVNCGYFHAKVTKG